MHAAAKRSLRRACAPRLSLLPQQTLFARISSPRASLPLYTQRARCWHLNSRHAHALRLHICNHSCANARRTRASLRGASGRRGHIEILSRHCIYGRRAGHAAASGVIVIAIPACISLAITQHQNRWHANLVVSSYHNAAQRFARRAPSCSLYRKQGASPPRSRIVRTAAYRLALAILVE